MKKNVIIFINITYLQSILALNNKNRKCDYCEFNLDNLEFYSNKLYYVFI